MKKKKIVLYQGTESLFCDNIYYAVTKAQGGTSYDRAYCMTNAQDH